MKCAWPHHQRHREVVGHRQVDHQEAVEAAEQEVDSNPLHKDPQVEGEAVLLRHLHRQNRWKAEMRNDRERQLQ